MHSGYLTHTAVVAALRAKLLGMAVVPGGLGTVSGTVKPSEKN